MYNISLIIHLDHKLELQDEFLIIHHLWMVHLLFNLILICYHFSLMVLHVKINLHSIYINSYFIKHQSFIIHILIIIIIVYFSFKLFSITFHLLIILIIIIL